MGHFPLKPTSCFLWKDPLKITQCLRALLRHSESQSSDDTLAHQEYEHHNLRCLRSYRIQRIRPGKRSLMPVWRLAWYQVGSCSQLIPQGGQLTSIAPWFKETLTCPRPSSFSEKQGWNHAISMCPHQIRGEIICRKEMSGISSHLILL